MTMTDVKKFVKEHKKEIYVGAALAGTTVLAVMGYRKFKSIESAAKVADVVENIVESNWFDVPDFPWNLRSAWRENYGPIFIADEMTLGELGAVGEALFGVEGLNEDTLVSIVLETMPKEVTT